MKRSLFILSTIIHLSVVLGQRSLDEIRIDLRDADSENILVAAHRAAHLRYPENSLPAIKEAITIGVDIIELDVKVTKDGVPILMHDRTINRTTTGSGEPSEYTYKELKKFRLIHYGDTTDHYIPTFREAMKITKGHVLVDIDIKTDKLDPIIEVIKKLKCEANVFWFDDDYESLAYVQSVDKNFMLMPRAYSYEMADSAVHRFHPELVHIDFSFYNKKVVRLIKTNKARIWINALGGPDDLIRNGNEDEAIDTLLEYGANVIQTDQPELLLNALRERNLHS